MALWPEMVRTRHRGPAHDPVCAGPWRNALDATKSRAGQAAWGLSNASIQEYLEELEPYLVEETVPRIIDGVTRYLSNAQFPGRRQRHRTHHRGNRPSRDRRGHPELVDSLLPRILGIFSRIWSGRSFPVSSTLLRRRSSQRPCRRSSTPSCRKSRTNSHHKSSTPSCPRSPNKSPPTRRQPHAEDPVRNRAGDPRRPHATNPERTRTTNRRRPHAQNHRTSRPNSSTA